ncbi:hypothetical protein Bca52824_021457 [Brassica carinata]|uniref:Uncharacterized protein n=1 Tax=Brassica carinata TaxID=52824 RepID=A0A8X7VWK4_BRACI|nr:hypothetical protein Bca52824_021457 [Brassica carinata]
MKTTRAALLCLLATLLISSAYSTVMRLELAHRDTLFPTSFRRIEDIIDSDQKRHSLISHKRTTTTTTTNGGGARLTLRSGFDYGAAQYFAEIRVGTPAKVQSGGGHGERADVGELQVPWERKNREPSSVQSRGVFEFQQDRVLDSDL